MKALKAGRERYPLPVDEELPCSNLPDDLFTSALAIERDRGHNWDGPKAGFLRTYRTAEAICDLCPFIAGCMARHIQDPYGFVAGMSGKERSALRVKICQAGEKMGRAILLSELAAINARRGAVMADLKARAPVEYTRALLGARALARASLRVFRTALDVTQGGDDE